MLSGVTGTFMRAKRQTLRMAGVMVDHKCGRFVLQLPADHLLPLHQREHPQYDRFLPVLVQRLAAPGAVVDVGANVGDTLACMLDANSALAYVCVEPDVEFFGLLQKNIERMLAVCSGAHITAIQALAGKAVQNVSLEGAAGTKHAVVGAGNQASVALDDMLHNRNLPPVRLLKSDVDGFDFDVLDSADTLLHTARPILYFECQFLLEFQRDGYLATIDRLTSAGYAHWCVFDNFGALLLQTSDTTVLQQLVHYVWRQNCGQSTRTIHYFDLLAWAPADDSLVRSALADYRAMF